MVYENNVDSISHVKTHWNKKVLDPKDQHNYTHLVVKQPDT